MTDPLDDITAAYEKQYAELQAWRHFGRTSIPVLHSYAETHGAGALRDQANEARRLLDLEEHE